MFRSYQDAAGGFDRRRGRPAGKRPVRHDATVGCLESQEPRPGRGDEQAAPDGPRRKCRIRPQIGGPEDSTVHAAEGEELTLRRLVHPTRESQGPDRQRPRQPGRPAGAAVRRIESGDVAVLARCEEEIPRRLGIAGEGSMKTDEGPSRREFQRDDATIAAELRVPLERLAPEDSLLPPRVQTKR